MDKKGIQQTKRLFTSILAAIFSLVSLPVLAQDVLVTLKIEDAPMDSVMTVIEKQTKYLFITNKDVDVTRRVSVSVNAKPINDALTQMVKGSDVDYRISGTTIALAKRAPAADKTPVAVSGNVLDSQGNAVIGATVIIKGTSIGGTTGAGGDFALTIPPTVGNAVLSINFLGYEPQDIPVGARTQFTITLREATLVVDEVVVTALGIKRAEKALSYNVQQVSAELVAANKDANFLNALNGKVAGVNINASSSGVGGASSVIMRGQKSISSSSNALYVIDGVPVMTKAGSAETEFGSRGSTDPMADINPEDIESISVLTGAAAAALYGSDAANGAVMVTTKRGHAGRLSVTVSSSTEIMTPFYLPQFQNRYGTGDYTSSMGSIDHSWGKPLNSANNYNYKPAEDYFQVGVIGTENVSFSAGSDKNQTYFSAGALNSKGIVTNNKYDRYNFTFRNTTSFLDDKMTLDVNASYILQNDRNVINQGTYNNPIVGAYLFPRGNDWNDIQMYERWNAARNLYTQYWPTGPGEDLNMQNPYWINYRNLRENRKDRYMMGAALSYDILPWLNVSGRIRMDNSQNEYETKNYASTLKLLAGDSEAGSYSIEKSKDKQIYADALININKQFGDDWSLQANIGASLSDMRHEALGVGGPISDGDSGEEMGLSNVFIVQNLSPSKRVPTQSGWRQQTQSVFASAEIGFRGTYYLTLTGRNEWPSPLAGPNSVQSSFFYPSVGVSVLLSELLPRTPNLMYMKIRASYASVGLSYARFLANPKFPWNPNNASWDMSYTNYPISNLKPERTQSYELGLTMRFLRHFNLDFTYYHSFTKNQTFQPDISVGSGYKTIYIQAGNVLNKGVELALGYGNTWGKFSWDTNYTFSANRNKILVLAENVKNPITGELFSVDQLDMGGLGRAHFFLREGGTLGDLYSLIDLVRDDKGAIYVDPSGKVSTQNAFIKLGSVLPDANMAWRNDFSVANFNFGFMVSARIGGIVFSRTQATLDQFGVSKATADARDAGGAVINGSDLVDPHMWYSTIANGSSTIPQYYTYSASNVRLQEASIGYTIPKKTLKGVCEISVSLVGRNLWMIYNKAPFDPESIATTGQFYQGIDNFIVPSLRNLGFNLRLKF